MGATSLAKRVGAIDVDKSLLGGVAPSWLMLSCGHWAGLINGEQRATSPCFSRIGSNLPLSPDARFLKMLNSMLSANAWR